MVLQKYLEYAGTEIQEVPSSNKPREESFFISGFGEEDRECVPLKTTDEADVFFQATEVK